MTSLSNGLVTVTSLPGELPSVGAARDLVRSAIDGLACEELADVAVLLTSEVVTNAIVHGASDVELTVSWTAPALRIAVSDQCAAMPVVHEATSCAEGGRGMLLIDQLADGWGADPTEAGKTVWFRLVTA